VLFHGINYHPHANQHRFQCLNQAKNLVLRFSEINSGLLASAMEVRMIRLFTERQEQPGDVLAATQVVLFKIS
jgi:hypothetical protein